MPKETLQPKTASKKPISSAHSLVQAPAFRERCYPMKMLTKTLVPADLVSAHLSGLKPDFVD